MIALQHITSTPQTMKNLTDLNLLVIFLLFGTTSLYRVHHSLSHQETQKPRGIEEI